LEIETYFMIRRSTNSPLKNGHPLNIEMINCLRFEAICAAGIGVL